MVTFSTIFILPPWLPNALLSSEACYANASALLRKHKNHCKPKMPRVPNLLEQFVMFYHN
ncbi:hypothetical protein H330_016055 [Vibrio parahaemolyticus 3631]|nr:hypothetical protein H330_016055 [Vibrio parahaemolyticus 3631]